MTFVLFGEPARRLVARHRSLSRADADAEPAPSTQIQPDVRISRFSLVPVLTIVARAHRPANQR